jgi:ectoine hydroxylase-related dioxygenase (phytanoyl-CoA dioxygenase family)
VGLILIGLGLASVFFVALPAVVLAFVTASRGRVLVIPGSHRFGRLSDDAERRLREQGTESACPVPAGGALLMSPLLLHSSRAAKSPSRRRVLHFEYSAAQLPGDLAWA